LPDGGIVFDDQDAHDEKIARGRKCRSSLIADRRSLIDPGANSPLVARSISDKR
jgi:hypothetical protein